MPYLEVVSKGTSVKELGILQYPTAEEPGLVDFHFRNVYSVFNWGQMPLPEGVEIDNSPLVLMAAFNFERLEKYGVPSHYLGLVDEQGQMVRFEQVKALSVVPSRMRVKYVNKLPISNDYAAFQTPGVNNYMLPLEVIFRNELPPESSVWKRLERKELTFEDLGLPADFQKGSPLPHPLLDFSTKYESSDRYLRPDDAQRMAGLSDIQFGFLKSTASYLTRLLTDYAQERGFAHLDGKMEFAMIPISIFHREVLVDVAGTWHEDRYEYQGQKISKQILRDAHKKLHPEWTERCLDIQELYNQGWILVEDWKSLVIPPEPLPKELLAQFNNLVRAATNHYLSHTFYPQASATLEEAIGEFRAYWDSDIEA